MFFVLVIFVTFFYFDCTSQEIITIEIDGSNLPDDSGTFIKGKEIFLPLRFLLTGLKSGPEMNLIIPLFDREEILRRLNV